MGVAGGDSASGLERGVGAEGGCAGGVGAGEAVDVDWRVDCCCWVRRVSWMGDRGKGMWRRGG